VRPSLNSVSRNGTSAQLEPKVMAVLVCLAAHAPEPVPKEKLLQEVWPDTFVGEGVLTRSVHELRQVFQDEAKESTVIQTIAKRGYRLVVPVVPVNGVPPVSPAVEARQTGSLVVPRKLRIGMWAVGGVALLGVSLFALNIGGLRDRLLTRNAAPVIRSLAVLPLQSLSADPAQEYFTEGMTDALITDLAQISALKVVSRTTVMRYQGTSEPLPQIARELNVDGIVEGTVQRSGNRVRITAQLIYAPADRHLWAQSFERDVKDMLALQSTVASEIAREVQVKVTAEEQAKLRNVRPVNTKALDAYVEARFHLDQVDKFEFYKDKQLALQEERDKALSYLDRAIQIDPDYVPAYLAYSDAVDSGSVPRLDLLPRAKAALAKALELDETSIPAHLAQARFMEQYAYDWPSAEKEIKRAIELNPNSADAHAAYSGYLADLGRSADADREVKIAQALDPGHDYFADAGVHRDDGQTIEEERQALEEKAPNDPFAMGTLAKVYAIAGRYKEAVEMYERALALYGWHDFVAVLKRADASGGPKFALQEWMRADEEYSRGHNDFPVFVAAFTYASLGDNDRAFAWLDKAYAQRDWCIIYLKNDSVWDPLRSDPRFKDLLRRVGLPP
jgi:TolB-like protein/DNA-binding winged helix-turn-helix (wHTH) protein